MNIVYNILLLLLVSNIIACGNTKYITKHEEVYIPIRVKIDKPNRPIYEPTDNTYTYMLKVLDYTKVLEHIIDKNNEEVKYE